jgi:putative restriction endonuclease
MALRAYIGVTDGEWFELLSREPSIEEVNFWQPGGSRVFRALEPGELFLFKLHSPRNFVVGGGFFAHATLLPVSIAWESFGVANGVRSLAEMRTRIEHYRRRPADSHEDYTIGCILLEQPFFLAPERWIPVPRDWSPNIVQGRRYDLQQDHGLILWQALQGAMYSDPESARWPATGHEPEAPRYGEPMAVLPRLGQGSFRIVVTDAYARSCAVTSERVLPVLQAAHIRPYAEGGDHRVDNGLLLRSDIHTLFDRGYVSVTPDYHLEVSRRIREDFENGRHYYALHGRAIQLPRASSQRPAAEFLRWHNEEIFLG